MPETEYTKICDECGAEIGVKEDTCPKCGSVLKEIDELAGAVERGLKILERRKARADAAAEKTKPQLETVVQRLRGLGKVVIREKKN